MLLSQCSSCLPSFRGHRCSMSAVLGTGLFWWLTVLWVSGPKGARANFICDFEHNNTCGMEWQSNLLPLVMMDGLPWLTASGVWMLDLKQVNHSIAPGARLMTKYFPAQTKNQACLVLKFLTFGPGMVRVAVIERTSVDKRLYEYDNNWVPEQPSDRMDRYWVTVWLPVDISLSEAVMFFIELTTDGLTPNGLFVLDHVAFLYQRCPFKQIPYYPCLDAECRFFGRV